MEFTLAQIKDFATDNAIYEKAQALVNEQAVVSLEIDDFSNPEIILINATLNDDKHYHEVNMSIDKDDFVIKAHLCNCTHQGGLPCSHCVAVLLKIYQQAEHTIVKNVDEPTPISDSWALQLMNTYEESIVYSTLAMNLKQTIRVEAVLEIRKHDIMAITLKIGDKKQYIIKDVDAFLDDIKHNVKKKYGKELAFLHNMNSFDQESQNLITFLEAHRGDTAYFTNTYRYRNCPQTRNLCLTKHALDEFYTMYCGEDVMYRIREKTLINMRFIDENPPFVIQVDKDEQKGYKIQLRDLNYRVFEGMHHIYVLYRYVLYRCDTTYSLACKQFLQTFQMKQDALYLSKEHMPAFYNNVIMSVKTFLPIEGHDISEFAPLPLVCKLYLDMPRFHTISARLLYCYGMEEFNAFSDAPLSTSRNFNDEIAVRLVLARYMTRIDANEGFAYIENSQDAIYDFLKYGMEELQANCEVYATDKIKGLQIKDSFRISMGVRMESNLLEVNFDTNDFPIVELADVLKAYRMNKKYYRMKNGSFVNIEDSALSELSSIIDGMHVSEKEFSEGTIKVEKYRSLYLDTMMKQADMIEVERDSSFKDILRGIKNYQDSDFEIPTSLKGVLRNYQKSGYRWLKTMATYGFGGILADDMGIGKTIQIISILEDEKNNGNNAISLVICPSSLLLNWQNEIEKFSASLTSIIIMGSIEERKALISQCQNYDVVITSYDYIKRDMELYDDINFTYEIIDEAQYIKNHNTKNAQSVKQVHALHRFALTGTPIENSLAELWSIFDFLMPGYLYNYAYFKREFEVPIVKDNDLGTLQELKRMVEPFILRRVKKDVLKELPEKVENTLYVDLDEEAKKLYMANVALIRKDLTQAFKEQGLAKSQIMILSMLTRLRQLCCDPRLLYENFAGVSSKLEACMELIETCQQSGKKVLLFSQFTSLLSLIENELKQRNMAYYLLKGSTPKTQRQQLVNAFNTNDIPVFLISLKAGGTGLNLTSAEVVIHFDPWWNISAQNQATDRAYRIGQHNNVQVFKLIARDTIEEKIMQLQERKKDLGDSIISQSDGIITSMSKDEIMDLF